MAQDEIDFLARETSEGIFAIHGDLDGEQKNEFQEREQFIGLIVGEEEFLLPIATVHEIIMQPPITFVPNAPAHIEGVINLRGTILPAISLRKLMEMPHRKPSPSSRIVIVRFESVTFGLLVDGITYVVSLLPSEIESQTLPGQGPRSECLGGLSKRDGKVIGIIDLSRILKTYSPMLETRDDEMEGGGTDDHQGAA